MAGFTPAFKAAFKKLTNLAGTTPKKLVAEHQQLTPEQRLQDMQQKFALFQNLPQTSDNINTMAAFLKAVNDTVESSELAADLERINSLQGANGKFLALKEVFKKAQTLKAFAECWNMYLESQPNVMGDIADLIGENVRGATQAAKNLNSQSDYDPVKIAVKRAMELFYMLFDILLISAGHKNVFVPSDNKQQELGALDPNLPGVFRNQNGPRVRRSS